MKPGGYKRLKEICDTLSGDYARELADEAPWIDSLHTAGLLSDEARDFYAARNTFRRQMQDISPIVRADVPIEAPEYLPLLRQYDDSLYRNDFYGYYRKYYEAMAGKCLGSTKSIRTSNSIYSDFTESFDRMERDTLPLGLLKEVMLTRYFEGINENFSIDEAKRYYDRLMEQLTDTTLRRVVGTRFGSELGHELQKEDDISLVSIAGDTTSMRKIIADNRGKVLYVDFYASWCAPCMAGMPASEQLRKQYADKEAVFVYLALNDKPDKWRNALEKAYLQGVEHNYLILEPRLSTMIENLEIQSIPRLLLFDRRGELAHRNAPRPESNQAQREIDKLLAEKK